ncbi:KH domain-containing protein, partial [Candidatus Amesbacteria bacterium]|nr:KH domain-containing protein [Candidatus Amesbacteria bacterium]
MPNYLTYLITPLLSHPDQLEISSQAGSVTIKVSPDDTGRVIGKHGLVINSLRTLLKTYCHLHQLP